MVQPQLFEILIKADLGFGWVTKNWDLKMFGPSPEIQFSEAHNNRLISKQVPLEAASLLLLIWNLGFLLSVDGSVSLATPFLSLKICRWTAFNITRKCFECLVTSLHSLSRASRPPFSKPFSVHVLRGEKCFNVLFLAAIIHWVYLHSSHAISILIYSRNEKFSSPWNSVSSDCKRRVEKKPQLQHLMEQEEEKQHRNYTFICRPKFSASTIDADREVGHRNVLLNFFICREWCKLRFLWHDKNDSCHSKSTYARFCDLGYI